MPDGREPLCLALVLCDGVYYDPWTGRKSLMGLLPYMQADSFPCVLPILTVHLVINECRGRVVLTLRVTDVGDQTGPVASDDLEVETDDPLLPIELEHVFTNVPLPHPGEYRVQLFCGTTPLMERRLIAYTADGGPGHD